MRRILVVDDDPHVRLAMATWLRQFGFRVATADGSASGLKALDVIDASPRSQARCRDDATPPNASG